MERVSPDTHSLTLGDGRRLAWAEYGDPSGRPLIYCHGFPGSRLEAAMSHDTAARLGIRIIAPDRPGLGRSDYQPGRRLNDFPADLKQLADHLKLGRVAVLGESGGGPYAMAAAAALPERITKLLLVSSIGPPAAKAGVAASVAATAMIGLMAVILSAGCRRPRPAPWRPRPTA